MDEHNETSKNLAAERPTTIPIPPRSAAAVDALFTGPKSPGPLIMLSNYLSDSFPVDDEFQCFSQILDGAKASWSADGAISFSGDDGYWELAVDFAIVCRYPWVHPSSFLNSPGFFSRALSTYGMSHKQDLAQVTAQVALSQSAAPINPFTSHQPTTFNEQHITVEGGTLESVDASDSDWTKSQIPVTIDRPPSDGYNWRKYGQKQTKGSECHRSYYRCTVTNCPVKKKLGWSYDGHITEIIYEGQHNHKPTQQGRIAKDNANGNVRAMIQHGDSQWSNGDILTPFKSGGDEYSIQATYMHLHAPNDSDEESAGANQRVDKDDDEANPKRRNIGDSISEVALSHRTVMEPKIIVQTISEVDHLDDGYRWRKYGQKMVKGSSNPRSYYKCTTAGCNVRKHIERSSTDPKAVITSYEGKHHHDVPAGKFSNNRNVNTPPLAKLQNIVGSKGGGQAVFLQLKEEQIVV
ncbi:hypothetical protein Nepgr_006945 [Nepenthes gracilis]|uniref:WRKY domain-containing protein n=1 Tax=Nepenthes gracilis TaxID=150966 RepID=A0AAD3S6B6_NEPGR|nr:hypothetical protein Nepgr_006945 [Nepenthes gracilis]